MADIAGDRISQAADFGAMRCRAGSLTRSPARAAARGFRLVCARLVKSQVHFEPFQEAWRDFSGRDIRPEGSRPGSGSAAATKIEWLPRCLMHTAHTAKTQADLIFIYNGAPPALVGSQAADFEGDAVSGRVAGRRGPRPAASGWCARALSRPRVHFEPFQRLGETFPGETFGRRGRAG